MTGTLETQVLGFMSHGTRCAAWLTLPAGPGPHPAVVLTHGLGGTHGMMLGQYEQHFADAGIATLAFDYRNMGASDGEPRQRIVMRRLRQDVVSALGFVREQPSIDAKRVGLWGTSLGSMHVVRVAAVDPDIAAAVVQCPLLYGPGAARAGGFRHTLLMAPAITADITRALLGRPRRYIPIIGEPGTLAVVTAPGALAGWNGMLSPGLPPETLDNRIAAANAMSIVRTTATRQVRHVSAPLLVCLGDKENMINSRYAERAAVDAPRGEVRHFAAGHFDIYQPPVVEEVLTEQTTFLRKHLRVGA
jgi:pimeloyl-ACP methyl ester carboxylesterase